MKNTKLTDRQINELAHNFFFTLQGISKSKRHLRIFFQALLSPSEYRDLILRWEILRMLSHDIPQREIVSRLGVSVTKITRGSLLLLDIFGEFAKIRTRIRL